MIETNNNEELILILDENGNSTGKLEKRSVVHEKLLWHNEIALWILNPKDKTLLLQRRAANKKSNPNKLAPCAGHVTGYDTIEKSVIREAQEEYGIDISKYKLNYMRTIRCKNPNNNCFSNHFYILADIPLADFKIQEEELSEVLYISLENLKNLVFSNSPEVAIRNNKINEEIFASFEEIFNN